MLVVRRNPMDVYDLAINVERTRDGGDGGHQVLSAVPGMRRFPALAEFLHELPELRHPPQRL